MIKTEFWADEKVGKLSLGARLLFIGMWNFADDSGICRGNPAYLRGSIFPYDDGMTPQVIIEFLRELYAARLVDVGTVSGEIYVNICNFLKHQYIKKPSMFRFLRDGWGDSGVLVGPEWGTSGPLVVSEWSPNIKEKPKLKPKPKEKMGDTSPTPPISPHPAGLIVSELNRLLGSKFNPNAKAAVKSVTDILDLDFTVEDILLVVKDCCEVWAASETMREHLNPVSILRPTKFEEKLEKAKNRKYLRPKDEEQVRLEMARAMRERAFSNRAATPASPVAQ